MLSRTGHNLPNFVTDSKKFHRLVPKETSPIRKSQQILKRSKFDAKNSKIENRVGIRLIRATFPDIFHKIQMTGGEGGMVPSNRNSYRWCYETTNTLHDGGGIDTIARLISIGNLLLFMYSKNTLLPREGELRGKSRPTGNFSALILPTVRIIYSIPLRNIYPARVYISFPYVCIRC